MAETAIGGNPANTKMFAKRLSRAVHIGFKKLQKFRKSRKALLAEYVGRFYEGDMGQLIPLEDRAAKPLSLIYQGATTMVANLAYNNPKARVRSGFMKYRPYGELLEMAVNHLQEEQKKRETIRKLIVDAIFSAGFAKCGMASSSQAFYLEGEWHDMGQPYCDRVDLDDLTIDPLAKDWRSVFFVGDRCRVPKTYLRQRGIADDDIRKMDSRYDYGQIRQEVASISGDKELTEANELVQYVDTVDVYVPELGNIYVIPYTKDGSADTILNTVPYEGPEGGPYHMLAFAPVPDNLMPAPLAGVWYDLHILAYHVARKAADQATRQKRVVAYIPAASDDAAELMDAEDGDYVKVEHIEGIKELGIGGSDPSTYEFVTWARQAYAEAALNLDLLSGTGVDEPTATQSQMVQANTSVRLADMQEQVYYFVAELMNHDLWTLHYDPFIELPMVKRTGGRDAQVVFTPEEREGDAIDYRLTVAPRSMARQDPNMKARRLMELASNVIPAFAQAAQMLGPAFRIDRALALIAQEMDIEELDEIIDEDVINQQSQRLMDLLDKGIPIDGKMMQMVGMGGPLNSQDAGNAMLKIGQPNPGGNMQPGITPGTEQNQMAQETAGDLQKEYTASLAG